MATVEERILAKVESLERLVALIATKELDDNGKIRLLTSIGIQPKDIAKMLDKTPNSVSIILSRMRKARKSAKATKISQQN